MDLARPGGYDNSTMSPDHRRGLSDTRQENRFRLMPGQIAILSRGLWRMRRDVAALSGLEPVFRPVGPLPGDVTAVAGWGHKPTAERARALAGRTGLPYLAFEDGFLRSVRPGDSEVPQSLILDRTGIYYDARQPSDLETLLNGGQSLAAADRKAAQKVRDRLKALRLSKYNDAEPFAGEPMPVSDGAVLVIDQTRGDASIAGALADEDTFTEMLDAAASENPGKQIVIKTHPETLTGKKPGYLNTTGARREISVLAEPCNPWRLFENVSRVYTVSSQLGFEALMAGCDVSCFGMPFYAGWGLTDDRQEPARRSARLELDQLIHAVFFRYCRYLCAWTRQPIDVFTAIDQLAFRRDHFHDQTRKVVCSGIFGWKRPAVTAMLTGKAGEPVFARSLNVALDTATAAGADVAVWGAKGARAVRQLAPDAKAVTIEDGFLRSVGLGAGFTRPLSLVFDRRGIYYDPGQPSDLEVLLETGVFSAEELSEAQALRELIVASRLTKYNEAEQGRLPELPTDRPVVLVPGQVADDESIRRGAEALFAAEPLEAGGANLALLKAVRARNRDAFIIYKPHPDVEAGLRAGKISREDMESLSDLVFERGAITDLFDHITALETATSLAGFEALLRQIPVATHGCPFYSGWGLTEDLAPCGRRTAKRSLDDLVAAALIRYPCYVTPQDGRVCPATIAAQLLVYEREKPGTIATRSQAAAKRAFAKMRYTTINLFGIESE